MANKVNKKNLIDTVKNLIQQQTWGAAALQSRKCSSPCCGQKDNYSSSSYWFFIL
jgi:hypothetical protein